MVPTDYSPFFVATAGAAAALVGLLFIAVSIAPERIAGPRAPIERRLVASAVFGFLSDAFFLSLSALIPRLEVGASLVSFGVVFFATFVPSALAATLQIQGGRRRFRRGILPLTATVVYGWQILLGVSLLETPHDMSEIPALTILIMVMFGISLIRAWELLGASRLGLLARLSPLIDLDDAPPPNGRPLPPPSDAAPKQVPGGAGHSVD